MNRRSCSKLVAIVLVTLPLVGCARAPGAAIPTPAGGATEGCGPATNVVVPDDSKPAVSGGRGPSTKAPLSGLTAAATDDSVSSIQISPLQPPSAPSSTSLQLSLLAPWVDGAPTSDTRFIQVYSRDTAEGLSIWEILNAGGWILYQGPARGHDALSAKTMLDAVGNGGHSAQVIVGTFDALLVHQDPIGDESSRAYGLYWSDGSRDISIEAVASSSEVVDFARSLYCAR